MTTTTKTAEGEEVSIETDAPTRRGVVGALAAKSCDVDVDDAVVKHVPLARARRVYETPVGDHAGAKDRAVVLKNLLGPALAQVDEKTATRLLGPLGALRDAAPPLPELLLAGAPNLTEVARSEAAGQALSLLRAVDADCASPRDVWAAAATALAAAIEADAKPKTLKILLDLVKAARAEGGGGSTEDAEASGSGDEGRRARALVAALKAGPAAAVLRPLLDQILAGSLPAKKLASKLRDAHAEASALGNAGDRQGGNGAFENAFRAERARPRSLGAFARRTAVETLAKVRRRSEPAQATGTRTTSRSARTRRWRSTSGPRGSRR